MIRIEEPDGWIVVAHRDHAHLAGKFATHWGNAHFAAPEPRADILVAVARHDDAWAARDASPRLTREGRPSAFSRELVGTYSAFEEIDFEDYLAVRGRAAELVAADNPYAAILISMHTVNLLTERADLSGLNPDQRELHRGFVERERRRQEELKAQTGAEEAGLRRGFEFLQACDSLSLAVCVRQAEPIDLRHLHPRRDGAAARLTCTPLGGDLYRVSPHPFDLDELGLSVPCRRLRGKAFGSDEAFRSAFEAAREEPLNLRLIR